jgi:hypothetical protein
MGAQAGRGQLHLLTSECMAPYGGGRPPHSLARLQPHLCLGREVCHVAAGAQRLLERRLRAHKRRKAHRAADVGHGRQQQEV